jgi:hypothetical protein
MVALVTAKAGDVANRIAAALHAPFWVRHALAKVALA